MNREIKFRAWHHRGVDKRQPMTMTYWGLGSGLDNSQFFKNAKAVMQYTGLKDKHGVDIYESDIVQHKNQYIDTATEVKWLKSSARWNIDSRYLDEIEVIGNVMEHPHLLEEQS